MSSKLPHRLGENLTVTPFAQTLHDSDIGQFVNVDLNSTTHECAMADDLIRQRARRARCVHLAFEAQFPRPWCVAEQLRSLLAPTLNVIPFPSSFLNHRRLISTVRPHDDEILKLSCCINSIS